MSNSNLTQTPKKATFSVVIQGEKYQNMINNTLSDPKKRNDFITAIVTAVGTNPALAVCQPSSILAAGLLGASLNLPPAPQFGYFYMIPYKVALKDENGKVLYKVDENGRFVVDRFGNKVKQTVSKAQFQLGYKGMIQLAIRSDNVIDIDAVEIKDGELKEYDPITKRAVFEPIKDYAKRSVTPTIGYYAWLELKSGFKKCIYWTREEVENHADRYSQAFSLNSYRLLKEGKIPERDMWKYSSYWYTSFDEMAKKTLLRQLISKWAPLSTELQQVMSRDETIMNDNNSYEYITDDDFEPEGLPLPENDEEQPQETPDNTSQETPDTNSNTPPLPVDENGEVDLSQLDI